MVCNGDPFDNFGKFSSLHVPEDNIRQTYFHRMSDKVHLFKMIGLLEAFDHPIGIIADDFWIWRAIVLVFHFDYWIDCAFWNGPCQPYLPIISHVCSDDGLCHPAFLPHLSCVFLHWHSIHNHEK